METLNTRDGVILALSFRDNIIFLEALLFLIVFHFSVQHQKSGLTTYYPKSYIEFLSMSLVTHKEGSFCLSRLPFGVDSGLFQAVIACYSLFGIVSSFISDVVTECFDLKIYYKPNSCRLIYKWGKLCYHIFDPPPPFFKAGGGWAGAG